MSMFEIVIKGKKFISGEDGYLDLNDVWRDLGLQVCKRPNEFCRYSKGKTLLSTGHLKLDQGTNLKNKFYKGKEEATIEYCKWVGLPVDSHGVSIITMRKEHFVGGLLEQIFPDLQRQFEMFGGKYYLDFYVPSEDLVIEYDELHHNSLTNQEKDRKREKEIGKKVFRVSEGSEIEDILFLKQTYCK